MNRVIIQREEKIQHGTWVVGLIYVLNAVGSTAGFDDQVVHKKEIRGKISVIIPWN